jgi:hypothetical protein
MEHYRNEVMKYNKIKSELQSKRQDIMDSGKTDGWKWRQLAELNEKAVRELKQWNAQVKATADEYTIAGQEIVQDVRKKPAGKTADAASLELHRGLARDAFSGLKPDEILQAFDRVVGDLAESELGLKWVYENTLKSLVREPAYELAIEETFDKHRTPIERAAHNELKRRNKFQAHDSTIRGIAEMDIDAIVHGNRPVYDDIGTLYDEMMTDL